jgi:hypothetical protein
VAQERFLRQDLDVKKRRRGLETQRLERFQPMELAGGVDIKQGDGEQEPLGQGSQPALPSRPGARRAPANHVVAVVDRLQEGLQVAPGPRLGCSRHEHKRQARTFQGARH